MAEDDDLADDLIPGGLKRSPSYHSDYGKKTYGWLKEMASGQPVDTKARRMKKLIEQAIRLRNKAPKRR